MVGGNHKQTTMFTKFEFQIKDKHTCVYVKYSNKMMCLEINGYDMLKFYLLKYYYFIEGHFWEQKLHS